MERYYRGCEYSVQSTGGFDVIPYHSANTVVLLRMQIQGLHSDQIAFIVVQSSIQL